MIGQESAEQGPVRNDYRTCQATCGNNDGTYTDCTLPAIHADVIPAIPHSFEMAVPSSPPASTDGGAS